MNRKFYLTTSVLLLSVLIFSCSLYGQQDKKQSKTPEEIATKISDRMKQNLTLSDEQYKQVYDLILNKVQSGINNKGKYKSLDKDSRKQMKKQNKEEFQKQLERILSKEQFQKFQENMRKHSHNKGKKKNKKESAQ